jgi:hypothetical protein
MQFRYNSSDVDNAVCRYFDIDMKDLRGKSRYRRHSWPRFIAFLLCKRYTAPERSSSTALGIHYGGRDHTTVLSGLKTAKYLLSEHAGFARAAMRCEVMLISSVPSRETLRSDIARNGIMRNNRDMQIPPPRRSTPTQSSLDLGEVRIMAGGFDVTASMPRTARFLQAERDERFGEKLNAEVRHA